MKKLKKITPEEVTKKLVDLVETRYGGDRKPLAMLHGVDEFYLWLFISGRRMPPDWLLKELNIVKKRKMVYEYYELVDGPAEDDPNALKAP